MQQKKRPKHLTHSELFFVCYVFYPTSGANPQRGSRVTVRITTKVPDQDRIFGVITHVGNIIGG